MGFTKLDSNIVRSSLWDEDAETCKVWITLLAVCNQYGVVRGTSNWVSLTARIPLKRCETILKKLQEPDPRSQTKDNDGRRLEACDGGWILVNYRKFRERKFDKTEYMRHYMAHVRQKSNTCLTKSGAVSVSDCSNAGEGGTGGNQTPDENLYQPPPGKNGQHLPPDAVGVLPPELAKLVPKLALKAHAAFAPPPSYPDSRVVANITELLKMGRKPEHLADVFEWRRHTKLTKYIPQSPGALTDPAKWEQWVCKMRDEEREEKAGVRA